MHITVCDTKFELGRRAAETGAALLRDAIATNGKARFILATGASQFEVLKELVSLPEIAWDKTEMFHLDEYVGISADDPASFRRYLKERFVDIVHPARARFVNGDADDLEAEIRSLNEDISSAPVDVAFVGIGENGHLAFNDPPADFETDSPYLVIDLDRECRIQQVGEGWFPTIDDVPRRAISMSIQQIMLSRAIICSVPDTRKAAAVAACLSKQAEVTPVHPASILKNHTNAFVFLDRDSGALLSE